MHQGRVIAAEFIGFCKSQTPVDLKEQSVSNHDELMSNFFAQPDALAQGKTIAQLEAAGVPEELRTHKEFKGDRPSFSILFEGALNAFACGQLLGFYEHRVAVEGFVYDINSTIFLNFSADADSIGIPPPTHCEGTLQDSSITQVVGYKM